MRYLTLALVASAGLLLAVPATAAPCCDKMSMPCCEKMSMPCCDHDASAVEILVALGTPAPLASPARQATEVWFQRPVVIDRKILQGHYVIEHDNDRMARGEPCTYIYAYDDRTKPVVTFHCTHLERAEAPQGTVVLYTTADGWQKMSEFQFKGETASHGVPTGR